MHSLVDANTVHITQESEEVTSLESRAKGDSLRGVSVISGKPIPRRLGKEGVQKFRLASRNVLYVNEVSLLGQQPVWACWCCCSAKGCWSTTRGWWLNVLILTRRSPRIDCADTPSTEWIATACFRWPFRAKSLLEEFGFSFRSLTFHFGLFPSRREESAARDPRASKASWEVRVLSAREPQMHKQQHARGFRTVCPTHVRHAHEHQVANSS